MSRRSVGADLCQRRFAGAGSFGHGLITIGLPHWFALARYVDLPPPGFESMPTVLNGKGVIEGIDRRRLSHWITIDGLAGQ